MSEMETNRKCLAQASQALDPDAWSYYSRPRQQLMKRQAVTAGWRLMARHRALRQALTSQTRSVPRLAVLRVLPRHLCTPVVSHTL